MHSLIERQMRRGMPANKVQQKSTGFTFWWKVFYFALLTLEQRRRFCIYIKLTRIWEGKVIGISFPISTESLQNVNMNDERSPKTNKRIEQWFRSEGSGGIPKGRPVPVPATASLPPGLQSSMKKIAAGVSASCTPGTSGQKPQKVELSHLRA